MKKNLMIASLLVSSYVMGDINTTKEIDLTKCKACHGQTFEKKALGKSKIVNQMKEEDIETSLKKYRDGEKVKGLANLMRPYVISLSDEEIKNLAKQIYMINK